MTNLRYLERLRIKARVPMWLLATQFGVSGGAYAAWVDNRNGMPTKYAAIGDRLERTLEALLAGKVLPLLTYGSTLAERHQKLKDLLQASQDAA